MYTERRTRERRKHTVWKYDFELEQTSFPESLLFARNTTFPALEIHGSIFALGFGKEAERVVAPPLLAGGIWLDFRYFTKLGYSSYRSSCSLFWHSDIVRVGLLAGS